MFDNYVTMNDYGLCYIAAALRDEVFIPAPVSTYGVRPTTAPGLTTNVRGAKVEGIRPVTSINRPRRIPGPANFYFNHIHKNNLKSILSVQ